MRKHTLFLLISILGLTNITVKADNKLPNDFKGAVWITDGKSLPVADSLFYEDDPAPLLRKCFSLKAKIKSAKLFITSVGYYSASINGKALSQNFCDPAWTDFSKRIYYAEYDIKNLISKGKNCIGVTLGNGFYNPLPLKFWGNLNLRNSLSTGRPALIASIKINYHNGKTEEIYSDKSWKYYYGPITRNNVYLGETYDARREILNWDTPNFIDKSWKSAICIHGPEGKLQKTFFPHIQQIDSQRPVNIIAFKNNKYVVDMGVNFTGTFMIRLKGNRGDTIHFRFGELSYPNGELNPMTAVAGQIKSKGKGGEGAPDVAFQSGTYIFGDKTDVWYSPIFSYRVYRYMEISGLKYQPETEDIKGIVLSSNVLNNNAFSCSSNLVNSIQDASRRTFLSNLMSVQSDCPGREKFGYGGDLYATVESFITNFDMQTFYRKTLYDWVDAVNDSIFIDGAPYVGLNYCGLNFEAAIFELQDNLLSYYGDTTIIKELYEFDLKWMEKAARIHPSGVVDKGIGDHESLINVPVQLIGTVAYLNSARTMVRLSELMHDRQNKIRFMELEQKIKKQLLSMYWDANSFNLINQQSRETSMLYINLLPENEKIIATEKLNKMTEFFNKQTFYAVLLYFDIVPEKDKQAVIDSLLLAIDNAPAGHFTTGIFGTKYILEALSMNGYADRVFDIVNSTAFPGWGYMIDKGATTLWEHWEGSDNVYSNNHPMFGSVSAWFYRYLGGIRPIKEYCGFKKFIIAPTIPAGLLHVDCEYQSPYGKIVSNWEKTQNGYSFHIVVPQGTIAILNLPFKNTAKIELKKTNSKKDISPNIQLMNVAKFELTEGDFEINCIRVIN